MRAHPIALTLVLITVAWPCDLAAQRPAPRNPRAAERISQARARLDSLDQGVYAIRRVSWDTMLGTAAWLEFSSDALQRRDRRSTVESSVEGFLKRHGDAFALDDARNAVVETARQNPSGMVHVRFRQAWNGIPIYGSERRTTRSGSI